MNTKRISLKLDNMRKAQDFILYPYNGGDIIHLQSDKRWIEANLRTGKGQITKPTSGHPNSWKLAYEGGIDIQLPEVVVKELQGYLWKNEGRQGNIAGVMFFENKELFSA